MHIHKLTLTGYRGARQLSLILDERLNVFVGMNGAGKSSVLDAAAVLLSWLANRIKHISSSGRPITEGDIRNGESRANLELTLSDKGLYSSWSLAKTRPGHSQKGEVSILIAATEKARELQAALAAGEGAANVPVLAYYPVNRAVVDIPLRIRQRHHFDPLSAYDEALTSGASFRTFFEWFREREDLENEQRKYQDQRLKPEGCEFPDRQLEAVRRAIEHFMPGFCNLTVRRNPLRMEVEKAGQCITVNQLSDGEKCLMAMIGDLARRLAIANPLKRNPLEGEGIVLIDEIDLHLHPAWQRRVIPELMVVFPHCQFLISTHSPHVVTHVQKEQVFLLTMTSDGLTVLHPDAAYGQTVERVLEDLMGLETTRPNVVDDLLHAIYRRIDAGELEQARMDIDALESRIGEDPDLAKASVLIRRKELIGK